MFLNVFYQLNVPLLLIVEIIGSGGLEWLLRS